VKFRPTKSHIEERAEGERRAHKAMTTGQVFTYFAKLDQARALVANPKIAKRDIPHIIAEAELKKLEPEAVATSVIREYRKWAARDAQIETKRMQRNRSNEA